ncbi:MAG TPA: hypothetical protein VJ255_09330 [Candidatus Acidoferrum sp.]|nr:hypothetical protein [Candidatus Acidoferrum sp.]
MIKTADGSAYTGLTANFIDGKLYLYVSNFAKGRVDVYDSAFQRVNLSKHSARGYSDEKERSRNNPFVDEKLPPGFLLPSLAGAKQFRDTPPRQIVPKSASAKAA